MTIAFTSFRRLAELAQLYGTDTAIRIWDRAEDIALAADRTSIDDADLGQVIRGWDVAIDPEPAEHEEGGR